MMTLLDSFAIGALQLHSGSWESALNSMQNCALKPRYRLFGRLEIHGDLGFWDDLSSKNARLSEEIQSYLNFGGVNPLERPRPPTPLDYERYSFVESGFSDDGFRMPCDNYPWANQ